MKNSPSFLQWSKGTLRLAHAKTFAFAVVCFLGFFMPTTGQAQVWIDDLLGRPIGTKTSFDKPTEVLPSPTTDRLQVADTYMSPSSDMHRDMGETKVEMEVRSLEGELVWQKRGISEAELSRSMGHLKDGIYLVMIKSSQGITHKTIAIHNN